MLSQSFCMFGDSSALGYDDTDDSVVECCKGGG